MERSIKKIAQVIFLTVLAATTVYGSPNGAPSGACRRIYPHHGDAISQDVQDSAYELDISQLKEDGGYHPGKKYNLVLSGSKPFRGLLVQGRHGNTPVGKFTVLPRSPVKLSACTPPESAVTHSNSAGKNNVQLQWTAPPKGTGDVIFHYAVVVEFDIFYATMKTQAIKELPEPAAAANLQLPAQARPTANARPAANARPIVQARPATP